jgi:hypothetical protein
VHARVYGTDAPFEKHSDESLIQRLEKSAEDHRAADNFYEYELRTHALPLEIVNESDNDYRDIRMRLDFQRIEGVGFSRRLYREDGAEPASEAYPRIESKGKRFSIEAEIPAVSPGTSRPVFSVAPRFWAREAASGKSLVVDYQIEADGLPGITRDTLVIHLRPEEVGS